VSEEKEKRIRREGRDRRRGGERLIKRERG
jgi:hypothetical protein